MPPLSTGVLELAVLLPDCQPLVMQPILVLPDDAAAEINQLWGHLVTACMETSDNQGVKNNALTNADAAGHLQSVWSEKFSPFIADVAFILSHNFATPPSSPTVQSVTDAGADPIISGFSRPAVDTAYDSLPIVTALTYVLEYLASNGMWHCVELLTLHAAGGHTDMELSVDDGLLPDEPPSCLLNDNHGQMAQYTDDGLYTDDGNQKDTGCSSMTNSRTTSITSNCSSSCSERTSSGTTVAEIKPSGMCGNGKMGALGNVGGKSLDWDHVTAELSDKSWLAGCRRLLFGFRSAVMEQAFLDFKAQMTAGADVAAACYHMVLALCSGILASDRTKPYDEYGVWMVRWSKFVVLACTALPGIALLAVRPRLSYR